MGIPESQLETWSHQGAVATAKATHESIRKALLAEKSPMKEKDFEIYLQGSYKNDTNIRGDSDVDVVVQLNSTFQSDLSDLAEYEKELFEKAYNNANYHWADFRRDVLAALRSYYGQSAVTEGNKSLKLSQATGRLPADIIVCLQYRKYLHFHSIKDQDYIKGIAFYTLRENNRVINFPKPHYDNGVFKNSESNTNGWYKPTVRLFKNARTYLEGKNTIPGDLAPSYFLECLIYNVPEGKFGASYEDTFCNAVNWLAKADFAQFTCQNEQLPLFGESPEQWSADKAKTLVESMKKLWNNW